MALKFKIFRPIIYTFHPIVYANGDWDKIDNVLLQPRICDLSRNSSLKEGNIGEVRIFPWLGVLRVHIHEGDNFKVALTGLVLIKRRYGIVQANDVANINPSKLRREGKAMFILNDAVTWSTGVQGYSLHPEYEFATYATIALVELDEDNYHDHLIPICWPDYQYIANQLYVVGYTDENQFLEKIIYKMENIDVSLCDEFYYRVGLKNNMYRPTNYHCGFAENNKKHCEWDNGMVLVSNSTGPWVLIGFGIKGAGCEAPGRFIDLLPHLPWIESSTDLSGF